MKKRLSKFFWTADFSKLEVWVNQMSNQGWNLVSAYFGYYTFEKCEPDEFVYRIDILKSDPAINDESYNYLRFMQGLGADYIGITNNWVMFRMKNSSNGFEVFSDMDSRINHLNKVLKNIIGILVFITILFIIELVMFIPDDGLFLKICIGISMVIMLSILVWHIIMLYNTLERRKKLIAERTLHE